MEKINVPAFLRSRLEEISPNWTNQSSPSPGNFFFYFENLQEINSIVENNERRIKLLSIQSRHNPINPGKCANVTVPSKAKFQQCQKSETPVKCADSVEVVPEPTALPITSSKMIDSTEPDVISATTRSCTEEKEVGFKDLDAALELVSLKNVASEDINLPSNKEDKLANFTNDNNDSIILDPDGSIPEPSKIISSNQEDPLGSVHQTNSQLSDVFLSDSDDAADIASDYFVPKTNFLTLQTCEEINIKEEDEDIDGDTKICEINSVVGNYDGETIPCGVDPVFDSHGLDDLLDDVFGTNEPCSGDATMQPISTIPVIKKKSNLDLTKSQNTSDVIELTNNLKKTPKPNFLGLGSIRTSSEKQKSLLKKKIDVCWKKIGLVIYPGYMSAIPDVACDHLNTMRKDKTIVDDLWANFAASAIVCDTNIRQRMVIPVWCPIDNSSPEKSEMSTAHKNVSTVTNKTVVPKVFRPLCKHGAPPLDCNKCVVIKKVTNVSAHRRNTPQGNCLGPMSKKLWSLLAKVNSESAGSTSSARVAFTCPPKPSNKLHELVKRKMEGEVMYLRGSALIERLKSDCQNNTIELVYGEDLRKLFQVKNLSIWKDNDRLFISAKSKYSNVHKAELHEVPQLNQTALKDLKAIIPVYSWGSFWEVLFQTENQQSPTDYKNCGPNFNLFLRSENEPFKNYPTDNDLKWYIVALPLVYTSILFNLDGQLYHVGPIAIGKELNLKIAEDFPFPSHNFCVYYATDLFPFILCGPYEKSMSPKIAIYRGPTRLSLYSRSAIFRTPPTQLSSGSAHSLLRLMIYKSLTKGSVPSDMWISFNKREKVLINICYGRFREKHVATTYIVSNVPKLGYFKMFSQNNLKWIKHPFDPKDLFYINKFAELTKLLRSHLLFRNPNEAILWTSSTDPPNPELSLPFNAKLFKRRRVFFVNRQPRLNVELGLIQPARSLQKAIGLPETNIKLSAILSKGITEIKRLRTEAMQQEKEMYDLKRKLKLKKQRRGNLVVPNSIVKKKPKVVRVPINSDFDPAQDLDRYKRLKKVKDTNCFKTSEIILHRASPTHSSPSELDPGCRILLTPVKKSTPALADRTSSKAPTNCSSSEHNAGHKRLLTTVKVSPRALSDKTSSNAPTVSSSSELIASHKRVLTTVKVSPPALSDKTSSNAPSTPPSSELNAGHKRLLTTVKVSPRALSHKTSSNAPTDSSSSELIASHKRVLTTVKVSPPALSDKTSSNAPSTSPSSELNAGHKRLLITFKKSKPALSDKISSYSLINSSSAEHPLEPLNIDISAANLSPNGVGSVTPLVRPAQIKSEHDYSSPPDKQVAKKLPIEIIDLTDEPEIKKEKLSIEDQTPIQTVAKKNKRRVKYTPRRTDLQKMSTGVASPTSNNSEVLCNSSMEECTVTNVPLQFK